VTAWFQFRARATSSQSDDNHSIDFSSTKSLKRLVRCDDVTPVIPLQDAKQSAIDYAKARAKFGHGQIRVLNTDGSFEPVIRFGETVK